MTIHPKSSVVNDFGTKIDVFLTNTLYFGDKSTSSEYLVKSDVLTKLATDHGLKIVDITSFEDHYNNFHIHMDSDVQTCSFTYASFVFQKI